MTAPLLIRQPVRIGGLYVCGDHRDTASIQGRSSRGRGRRTPCSPTSGRRTPRSPRPLERSDRKSERGPGSDAGLEVQQLLLDVQVAAVTAEPSA